MASKKHKDNQMQGWNTTIKYPIWEYEFDTKELHGSNQYSKRSYMDRIISKRWVIAEPEMLIFFMPKQLLVILVMKTTN